VEISYTLHESSLPVLMYHSLGTDARPAFRRWQVSLKSFGDQLTALTDADYRIVSLTEALRHPTPRTVAITFDDGFRDSISALPLLRAVGGTATFFVPTAYVGQSAAWLGSYGEAGRPLLTWMDLDNIVASGHEVGAHGHRHLELDTLSYSALEIEVNTSRDTLTSHFGEHVTSFCYPYGYHTATVRSVIEEAGFACAAGVGYRIHSHNRDRFQISRLLVGDQTGGADITRLITAGQGSLQPFLRATIRAPWRYYRRICQRLHLRIRR
jgi:peptidoglycan/xylan/chitin deacetylase (PgdA/CDA1 family)